METATAEIREIEDQIEALKKKLATLRREQMRKAVEDFEFQALDGSKIKLSQLFAGKPDLILVHNMGERCGYCTLWADGFEGVKHHLGDRAGFVLLTQDPPEKAKAFVDSREWSYPVVCDPSNEFSASVGMVGEDGTWPGASGLRMTPNGIERVATAVFGPGDDFCPTWHLFELLEGGPGDWEPKFTYVK